jgi:hypothetical protein
MVIETDQPVGNEATAAVARAEAVTDVRSVPSV